MSLTVHLEIGHEASLRSKPTTEGFTHDWEVFVRGAHGTDIHYFVDKVVFVLHETFPKPRRVVKEPPYSLKTSGYAGFNLPIEVYLKNPSEPRKLRFNYDLQLQPMGPTIRKVQKEKYVFSSHIPEEFRTKLLKGGATLGHTSEQSDHSSRGSGAPVEDKTNQMTSKPKMAATSGGDIKKPPKFRPEVKRDNFELCFGLPYLKTNKVEAVPPTSTPSSAKQTNKPMGAVPPAPSPGQAAKVVKPDKDKSKKSPHKDKTKSDKPTKDEKKKDKSSKERDRSRDKPKKDREKSPTTHKPKKDKREHKENKHHSHKEHKRNIAGEVVKKEESSSPGGAPPPAPPTTSQIKPEKREKPKEEVVIKKEVVLPKPTPPPNEDKPKHKHKKKDKERSKEKKEERHRKPEKSVKLNGKDVSLQDKGGSLFGSPRDDEVLDNSKKAGPMAPPPVNPQEEESSANSSRTSSREGSPVVVMEQKKKKERKKDKKNDRDKDEKKRKRKMELAGEAPPPPIKKERDDVVIVAPAGTTQNSDDERKVSSTEDVGVVKTEQTNSTIKNETEDYMGTLRELQHKIMGLKDNSDLQKVVQLIAETGRYEVSAHTFDFDLCLLDRSTVRQLQDFFSTTT